MFACCRSTEIGARQGGWNPWFVALGNEHMKLARLLEYERFTRAAGDKYGCTSVFNVIACNDRRTILSYKQKAMIWMRRTTTGIVLYGLLRNRAI